MKFQMTEKVPGANPEDVLQAMEGRLRLVSSEVVREGQRITLVGLGPSPRVMNKRDRTVLEVRAEDGASVIEADVVYQASSLLGDTSQDAVVRAKLDRVFAEMREILGQKAHSIEEPTEQTAIVAPPDPQPEAAPHNLPKMRFAAEVPVAPSIATEEPEAIQPIEHAVEVKAVEAPAQQQKEALPASTPEIAASNSAPVEETAVAEEKKEAAEPAKPSMPELPAKEAAVLLEKALEKEAKTVPAAQQIPKFSAAMALAPEPEPVQEEKKTSRLLQLSAWAAAFIVLVLAPAAWLYMPRGSKSEPAVTQPQPQPVAAATTATPPQPLPPEVAPQTEPVAAEDPAEVVKEWETALRSTDAAQQAAFYADPVERYFLRHNVSRDSIQADKQSQIEKRQGDWSVAMEQVKVQQQGDAASVHLIKHFTVRANGKLSSQWFVPSALQLKRVDGKWQIISERDLGWANSMDELE